jgi:hypothetical protein
MHCICTLCVGSSHAYIDDLRLFHEGQSFVVIIDVYVSYCDVSNHPEEMALAKDVVFSWLY